MASIQLSLDCPRNYRTGVLPLAEFKEFFNGIFLGGMPEDWMFFTVEEAIALQSELTAAIQEAQDAKQANVIRENVRQMGRPIGQITALLEAHEAANRKEGVE